MQITFFNIILVFFQFCKRSLARKESGFEHGFSMFLQKKVFYGHFFSLFFGNFFKTISDSVKFVVDPSRFWQKWHFLLFLKLFPTITVSNQFLKFWRTPRDPERKFWPLFDLNNIFLATAETFLQHYPRCFSNFARCQWQGIWIWAQFLYVFGKKKKGLSCPFFPPLLWGFFSFFKIISDSVKFAINPPRFWQKWHFQIWFLKL